MIRTITIPPSKSLRIRQLVSHFIQCGKVLPVSGNECSDVLATHRALCAISDAKPDSKEIFEIDVADCGAAYRFMMALLSVTPGRWHLTGEEYLLHRPMEELVQVLLQAGARIVTMACGWRIDGCELEAAELSIDCSRSTQFASALLLIAPKIGLKTLHVHSSGVRHLPYVAMTQTFLDVPVAIPELPAILPVLGRPGDWSAAAYWYAVAMLHPVDEFELLGLSLDSVQGDAVIARWLAPLGVASVQTNRGVRIVANPTAHATAAFDVADYPDLVPVLASLACLLPADFTFKHVHNLLFKESNRAEELARQLAPFAQAVELDDNVLHVKGKPRAEWPTPPYCFQTKHDHRLAMAFALFGKDARLDDVNCLRKSYPGLIELLD